VTAAAYHRSDVREAKRAAGGTTANTPQHHLKITKVNKVTINQKGQKNEITFRNHN
jgi:hypothetical protein